MQINFMRFFVSTKYRSDFFNLGRAIGEFFKDRAEHKQRRMIINGKIDGGKSVIGFGVDAAFRPERYKRGLDKSKIVDIELAKKVWEKRDPPVVFKNIGIFATRIETFLEDFNAFAKRHQSASILIASNLKLHDRFNSKSGEFEQSKLDVSIEILTKAGYKFQRDIIIDTVHEGLADAIAKRDITIVTASRLNV